MREQQKIVDLHSNNRSWTAYTRETAARQADVLPEKYALPQKKTQEERRSEERRKRWERNIRRRAIEREVKKRYTRSNGLSRLELGVIAVLLAILLASCIFLLNQQSSVTASLRENQGLEQQYQDLLHNNEILESTIEMSIDPKAVLKKAVEEMGMGYPTKAQIVTYKKSDEGFVYQREDIPVE